MDIGTIKKKIARGIGKYKYSILVLLIGFVLMLTPEISGEKTAAKLTDYDLVNEPTLEQRLSAVLSNMSGAGDVEVILTKSAGEEVIYQINQDSNIADSNEQTKSSTVTITDSDRNQSGLVRQVNPARYQGAIILCQGADDPVVCLAIVDAVSKATGLGANKISVLKMK